MLGRMEFRKNVGQTHSGSVWIKKRPVSDAQEQQLQEKLLAYRRKLLPKNVMEFMPIGPPNVFFEFLDFK